MRFLIGVVSILGLMLLAPGASAQSSLAGLAKKTKQEREEKSDDPKVIRTDDLRHTKSRVYVPPGSAKPAAAAGESDESGEEGAAAEGEGGEGSEERTPAEERAALTQQYQADLDLQKDRVSKLQEQISDAEMQLADQTTYYPGNPRRASLMELIEKCNAEIADAQSTIAEIRRRARAQGISLR
jgi:hypothetical protein